ncbi:MAG: hypothetical protein ABS58_09290 [Mesorhizobium sp. SCN 65-20]|mgnify:CR=1 FL=1|nr:MAG: hypothetical protein ABS58_09290 [Mesorhizobium sp. SCN 65-20]
MNQPWRITNFERVLPIDPDHVWAVFDIEFNGGDVAGHVQLRQVGQRFELLGVEMAPDTREAVISAALEEVRRRPA